MKDIITMNILKGHYEFEHNRDYMILLNLSDKAKILVDEVPYELHVKDIIVLNPLTSAMIKGDALLLYRIDIDEFRSLFQGRRYYLIANSTQEYNNNYELLVSKLLKLLVKKEENSMFSKIEYRQIENELLIFLIDNFTADDMYESDDKLTSILDYIAINCTNNISLSEISNEFGLTPQYFSRYFKEKMKITFHHYLNDMKLQRCLNDLMYSNKTVLKIALDNGFPNVSSFNKAFLQKYEVRPSDYKKIHARKMSVQEESLQINDVLNKLSITEKKSSEGIELFVNCQEYVDINKYWKKVLNLGELNEFYDKDVQQQLLMLQKELNFEYIRFRLTMPDNYSADYYFYNEDRIFDSLMNMSFQLWLIIDLRNLDDQFMIYFQQLLSHFANRYSIDNVRHWNIELLYNTIFDETKCKHYFHVYEQFDRILKHYGFENEIVGPGMLLGQMESLNCFIDYITKKGININRISFSADIFDIYHENGYMASRNKDVDHLKNKLHMIKNKCNHRFQEILITSWRSSIIGDNVFNDSCYKGAYILKNIIDCYGYSDALCYSVCLDLLANSKKNEPLIGAEGLVTKHGIKKPAFYAYDFLNRLGKYFVCKNDHSLISSNGRNLNIVCHNCKRLGYKYYLEEEALDAYQLGEYFDNLDPVQLHYHFHHIENGTYLIKIRTINKENGSVQDILFSSFERHVALSKGEFDYLHNLSVPLLKVFQMEVVDCKLDLSVELLANEIKYIHIIYLY